MAAPFDNSTNKSLEDLSPPTGGVVVDLGTGDGRFVSAWARQHPDKFFIGIDANAKPLEKISMKATRKPAKGGLANVLFLQAAAESLPDELNDVADEIHVHFPWGSLLRAVAVGDETVLRGLRRIAAPDGWLEIVIGVDLVRDRAELARLGLPPLTPAYLEKTLRPKYEAAGFAVRETGALPAPDWARLKTSWARKLQGNDSRTVIYLVAQASDQP